METNNPEFDELMDGVLADPDSYELTVRDCTATVGSHIDYELELTNRDNDARAFSIEVFVQDLEGRMRSTKRSPQRWMDPGTSLTIKAWTGWDDDYDPTPVCNFVVLRSPFEALD